MVASLKRTYKKKSKPRFQTPIKCFHKNGVFFPLIWIIINLQNVHNVT